MKKSFKNLMLMIFVVLLILFPMLKYAIQKRGKGDSETLNSPFEKSDEPEKDNGTKKIVKPNYNETKTSSSRKKPGSMAKKKQNVPLRRSISTDLPNKNSNGLPVISDSENINFPSSTNKADLQENENEGNQEDEINEISNLPKNRSSFHLKSKEKSSLSILKRNKSKNLNESENKNLKKSSVIKNGNDPNEDQIRKLTINEPNGNQKDVITLSPETVKLKIDINNQEKPNLGENEPFGDKPQIRKVHPYEKILDKKLTDAEKITLIIKKKNKKRKNRTPLYLENVMAPIPEDDADVIRLETEEPETEENVNIQRKTDTSVFSDFKYKIDRYLQNVWDSMKKFNEKEQFTRIYKLLYENKFKNGIQSVHEEEKIESNLEGEEESKGNALPKNVEKYKNEKRPASGEVKTTNSKPPRIIKNPFDENTLKNQILRNMESFKAGFTPDHWFIRFIEICHNFHTKHMAKDYYKLGQEYSEDTSEAFFNWAWRNYLNEFGNTKNRYSPNEVSPFISMLYALNHHIRESDRINFTNAYRNYLERNVLENFDDNEIEKSTRLNPYYGILSMLNAMDEVKLSEANNLNRTNSLENAILNSNSSTGNTTDVSDYDLNLFG